MTERVALVRPGSRIGGLISMGIIGLCVGPVALAVTFRLKDSWIAEIDAPQAKAGD